VNSIHSMPCCHLSESRLLVSRCRLTMTISPETCTDSMVAKRMTRRGSPLTHEHSNSLSAYRHKHDDTYQTSSSHFPTLAKAVPCKCGSNRLRADLMLARYPVFCTDTVRGSESWRNSLRSAVGDRRKWSESACPCSPRLVVWS
jgi:hypothetical protein